MRQVSRLRVLQDKLMLRRSCRRCNNQNTGSCVDYLNQILSPPFPKLERPGSKDRCGLL